MGTKEFCTGSGSHKTRCQAFKLISSKLPEFEKALKRGAGASDAAAKSATPKQPDSTPNSASDNRAKQVQKTAEQMLNTRKESAKVVQKAATKKDVPAKAAKPAEAAPPASGDGESNYEQAVDMMEKHYCKSGGDQVVCKIIASLKQKLTAALNAKNLGPYKAALAAREQEFCGGSKHHKTRCQAFKLISEKLPAFEQKMGFDSTPNSASDNRAKQVQKTAEQMLNTRKESAKVVQKAATKKDVPAKAAKPAKAAPPASGDSESNYEQAVDMMEKHYCKSGGDQVVCKIIASLKQKLSAALNAKNLGPYKAALAAREQEFCGGSKHHKTRCQAFKLISEK